MPNDGNARSSWRFRVMEWIAAELLWRMAKIAKRHLDAHVVEHLAAAMETGDSQACGPDCPFRWENRKDIYMHRGAANADAH